MTSGPPLEALKTALESAERLLEQVTADPATSRVLRAFSWLTPEDRDVLSGAIERAVGWRRVNGGLSAATGVYLRANPNPRLFVRVVDPAPQSVQMPTPDDAMLGALRLARLGPVLAREAARAVWEPAVREAITHLTPEQRVEVADLVRSVLALITSPGLGNEAAA